MIHVWWFLILQYTNKAPTQAAAQHQEEHFVVEQDQPVVSLWNCLYGVAPGWAMSPEYFIEYFIHTRNASVINYEYD